MPYTNAQLQAASSDFRATYGRMPDELAIRFALNMLATFERHNCPIYDERTGEVIEGEPFIVEEEISYWIPAARGERWRAWRGNVRQFRTVKHYYADEESAIEDGCRHCDCCGSWYYKDNVGDDLEVYDNWYCSYSCASEAGWACCDRCGDWVRESDAYIVNNGDYYYYCDDVCAERDGWVRCEHCDGWMHEDNAYEVDGETWCESCADYYSSVCDECRERYPDRDIEYDEERDQHLCSECRGECRHHRSRPTRSRSFSNLLHEYGWAPRIEFFHTVGVWNAYSPKPPLFMGVELETDGGSNRAEYVEKLGSIEGFCDYFWMTKDSSLNNGVEITSQPCTLDFHESMLETVYGEISKAAVEFGYRSHDGGRCGLHVHVNRSFFGKDRRVQDAGGYKLMRLLQRFEQAFTLFSRRTDNYWCSYKMGNRDYKLKDDEVKANRAGKDEAGLLQKAGQMTWNETTHAQALNFQHDNTFEFRIFRGTLKWTTYFACLGMVDGLCRTVKKHGSVWVESVNWYDLMDEVIANCENEFATECLCAYLDEKELRRR